MHAAILEYIETHKDRFLEELKDWIRIPSVSADPAYAEQTLAAANWLKEKMLDMGLDGVELLETGGFPAVYGEKLVSPHLPTVLIYGHYDVQPPDPIELWHTPPFEPTVRDGKLYARGATDDKGQCYMHVKAVEVLLNTTGLPCNVKFFIEGEEEVGSENLEGVLRTNADKLKADVLLISDTSMIANDVPSIAVGLRGLSYVEVKVVGPNRDLHSGTYGGAVENPLNVLCKMVAQLKDANNRITIPGFYEKVDELSLEQRAELESAPFDEAVYRKELDLAATDGEAGYTTRERSTIRPTLDLNGIWGGYTGAGAKTVLPSMAQAKISMRLVPNQDPDEITELFTKHFLSLAPATVKVSVSPHHGGRPFLTSTDSPAYRAAEAAMTETFGKKPIPTREGGSIPILALFQEVLQAPIILMGFGLDTDALHSPNEHYGLFNYFKGIETLAVYHHKYKEVTEKELA